MAQTYISFNGAIPTTAAPVKVAVGNAIKTLQQVATPATAEIKIIAWCVSSDGLATSGSIECELFGTTAAASVGTSVTPSTYENAGGPPSLCIGGTALTCFSPGTEGTVANYRSFDLQILPYNGLYVFAFPLGREPRVAVSQFVRVRVTASVTGNSMYSYIVWEE